MISPLLRTSCQEGRGTESTGKSPGWTRNRSGLPCESIVMTSSLPGLTAISKISNHSCKHAFSHQEMQEVSQRGGSGASKGWSAIPAQARWLFCRSEIASWGSDVSLLLTPFLCSISQTFANFQVGSATWWHWEQVG